MIICKICNPDGNGYCSEHSTGGTSYGNRKCENCKHYEGKGRYLNKELTLNIELVACSFVTDKRKFRLKTRQEDCPAYENHP